MPNPQFAISHCLCCLIGQFPGHQYVNHCLFCLPCFWKPVYPPVQTNCVRSVKVASEWPSKWAVQAVQRITCHSRKRSDPFKSFQSWCCNKLEKSWEMLVTEKKASSKTFHTQNRMQRYAHIVDPFITAQHTKVTNDGFPNSSLLVSCRAQ